MNAELKSPESLLREAREMLRQEWTHLQIVGRALTPGELRRAENLSQAILLLDDVLGILGQESLPVVD
jgi:hypothetical protein